MYKLCPNQKEEILNIGCGNGEIQDYLYEQKYTNITNNDISEVVIEEMEGVRK